MTMIAPSTLTYHLTCDEEHQWAAVYSTRENRTEFRGFARVDEEMLRSLHQNTTTHVGEDGLLRCSFPG